MIGIPVIGTSEKSFRSVRAVALLAASIASFAPGRACADLVAYWSFNSYDGDATSVAPDQGSGTFVITGFPAGDLAAVTGTTVNAVSPTVAGLALQVSNSANCGDWIDVTVDLTNYINPVISFATSRNSAGASSNQGFNDNSFQYSVNSGSFVTVETGFSPGTSFATKMFDLSAMIHDAVDHAAMVVFRYIFDGGGTGTNQNNLDNFQINATLSVIPEASSFLFGGLGCAVVGLAYGRRWQRDIAVA